MFVEFTKMSGAVILEEDVQIPLGIDSLVDFRRWALSDKFPERGRIDFIQGDIEIDMSPENVFYHGTLKTELASGILARVKQLQLGHVCIDTTRISSVPADLSAEPDVVVISQAAIEDGRVKLIPAASGDPDSFVEVEGGPDIVVEIVSDSSVRKDTRRLPGAYFDADVQEYWLVDARKDKLHFQIHHRGRHAFETPPTDGEGFQVSGVLQCRFRLVRERGLGNFWRYELVRSV
jgi:Uma2 family endonuclease